MGNLKIIDKQELKDWAIELFKKIHLIWLMFPQKKKLLEEHWLLVKFMLEKKFLI